jgi:nucleoside-diphosphate-sugar epimerase
MRQILENKKIDVIFHLACPTGVDNLERLGEEMLFTSAIGTKNVMELAKITKSKVVFTSSSESYGNPEVFPQRETYEGKVSPTGYRSTYEEGKRFAESVSMFYFRKFKVDVRIARVFNTYGPGMNRSDARVMPRFMNQCMNNNDLTIEGKGLQTRTLCFVDDLVAGLLVLANKGKSGEVYNLGNDNETKIIDLAKMVIKITGKKIKIKYIERPDHDHDRRLPDLSKIRKLGWSPKIDLEEGIRRTVEWYGF